MGGGVCYKPYEGYDTWTGLEVKAVKVTFQNDNDPNNNNVK